MSKVIVSSGGKLQQRIQTAKHEFVADEPVGAGGDDAGPDPYQLLLASLGACTSMTLQIYARHKRWNLKSVRVTLSHSRVHETDCEDCDKVTRKLDLIERHIELEGELDDEQRARLMEIAKKCPVHRTLTSTISIKDYPEQPQT